MDEKKISVNSNVESHGFSRLLAADRFEWLEKESTMIENGSFVSGVSLSVVTPAKS